MAPNNKLALLFSFLAACAIARAADNHPVLAAVCGPAQGTVRVDGLANEAAWRDAAVLTHFTIFGSFSPASPQSIARVCYDSAHLYLHVKFIEPEVHKLVAKATNRDGAVWFDDSVEVFIDPTHDHEHYFQFVVNSLGTQFDKRGADAEGWNADWQAAAHVDHGWWAVELAFPFRTLGLKTPRPGQVIGFNVCRERYAGKRQLSHWSRTPRSFHDCPYFGHLVFADGSDLLPGGEWLAQLGADGRTVNVWTAAGRTRCDSRRSLLAAGHDATFQRVRQRVQEVEANIDHVRKAELRKRLAAIQAGLAAAEKAAATDATISPEAYLRLRASLADLANRSSELDWDIKFAELFGD